MAETSVEPQETECSVCHENFIVPKILRCGHLFCRNCIESVISSKSQTLCPLCRTAFVDKTVEETKSPANIVETLPTDFVMDALAASTVVLAQNPVCCVCEGVQADHICLQCRDKLCSECAKAHKKLSATRCHVVESITTVTAGRLASSRPALCPKHGDKQADLFCTHHGVAICAVCVVSTHQKCTNLKDLDNEMKSAEKSMQDMTATLAKAQRDMKQTIGQLDNSLKNLDTCRQLYDSLINICEREKELSMSVDLKKVRETKLNLHKRLMRVKAHRRIVSRARAVRPRPGLIYTKRELQDRIKILNLSANLPLNMSFLEPTKLGDFIRRIKSVLRQHEQQEETSEVYQLTFHRNRGYGIVLESAGACAVCQDISEGVVVSSQPLTSNVLYNVSILEMKREWQPDDIAFCGITGTNPNDLSIKGSILHMEDVLNVSSQRRSAFNTTVNVCDKIGLMIDSTNNFHFFHNKRDLGIALANVPRPCYAVFDLDINVKKVMIHPTTKPSSDITDISDSE